jgi:pyridoxal phosphate enzyme (YggS family)
MGGIGRNLEDVERRIGAAAARVDRDLSDVTLVAVTKTHPPEAVAEAYRAGARQFGENRAEEGVAKMASVAQLVGGAQLAWHMVGHVQSRKARDVAGHFTWVQSVDTLRIARRLDRFAEGAGRSLSILMECNVAGEASKYGFDVAGWERDDEQRSTFLALVRDIVALPHLRVAGLMTMAPLVEDPEEVRPVFRSLRALLDCVREAVPGSDWSQLSMGMTDDFEVAIEEGATMVRIGRAIFGTRRY